ncbi:MAG TPA: TRAP transporter small permease [Steroidobacteraceae bacterium]|nr:TRAP transporter small permease [Steroidobacteraceae bacterium]
MSHAPATPPSTLAPLARAAIAVAGVALVAMAGIQAWQVFARYVLNDAPSWTEPLALLCMSTTMMFGAAAGVHSGRHFGFFIAVEHARPALRRLMQLIARAIAASVGILFALWGGDMMIDAWDYEIAGASLPQGIVFLPLCLGGVLIALFSIEQLIRLWQSQSSSAS